MSATIPFAQLKVPPARHVGPRSGPTAPSPNRLSRRSVRPRFTGIAPGDAVLRCRHRPPACWRLTAARIGAKVTGLDLTPRADRTGTRERRRRPPRPRSSWTEGDAGGSSLPDGVVRHRGQPVRTHVAPRPMSSGPRCGAVLKPGGRVAFRDLAARASHRPHVGVRGTQLAAACPPVPRHPRNGAIRQSSRSVSRQVRPALLRRGS